MDEPSKQDMHGILKERNERTNERNEGKKERRMNTLISFEKVSMSIKCLRVYFYFLYMCFILCKYI